MNGVKQRAPKEPKDVTLRVNFVQYWAMHLASRGLAFSVLKGRAAPEGVSSSGNLGFCKCG